MVDWECNLQVISQTYDSVNGVVGILTFAKKKLNPVIDEGHVPERVSGGTMTDSFVLEHTRTFHNLSSSSRDVRQASRP